MALYYLTIVILDLTFVTISHNCNMISLNCDYTSYDCDFISPNSNFIVCGMIYSRTGFQRYVQKLTFKNASLLDTRP